MGTQRVMEKSFILSHFPGFDHGFDPPSLISEIPGNLYFEGFRVFLGKESAQCSDMIWYLTPKGSMNCWRATVSSSVSIRTKF